MNLMVLFPKTLTNLPLLTCFIKIKLYSSCTIFCTMLYRVVVTFGHWQVVEVEILPSHMWKPTTPSVADTHSNVSSVRIPRMYFMLI